jgi:hypothetical protein
MVKKCHAAGKKGRDMSEPAYVRVLDVDPELAYKLDEEALSNARRYAVAEVCSLQCGKWEPKTQWSDYSGHIGYLVLEGLLQRSAQLANSACAELVGQGDVLRPWQEDCGWEVAHYTVEWEVLQPTRLAILDRRFATVACRWPEIIDVILSRTIHRARCLALHLAITHLTRVDVRILATLWHLADRWGRVTPEGVVLPLKLTHQNLARLVGAQRPSVTTALGELTRSEVVTRRDDGTWLLHDGPPEDLHRIRPPRERLADAADGEPPDAGQPGGDRPAAAYANSDGPAAAHAGSHGPLPAHAHSDGAAPGRRRAGRQSAS